MSGQSPSLANIASMARTRGFCLIGRSDPTKECTSRDPTGYYAVGRIRRSDGVIYWESKWHTLKEWWSDFDNLLRYNEDRWYGRRRRRHEARKQPDEYLYVIAGAGCLVKIGRSKNPAKRLVDLQVASGIRLMLAYVSDATKRAAEIERATHRWLHAERRIGEWFETTIEEAVAAILACWEGRP